MPYEANKNAWMIAEIWKQWLIKIDKKMQLQKRHIPMLSDNCAASNPAAKHHITHTAYGLRYHCQFKKTVQIACAFHLVNIIDAGTVGDCTAATMAKKLNVLDSLHMQWEAWNKISQSTIANCYRRASFVMPSDHAVATQVYEDGCENVDVLLIIILKDT